MAKLIQIVCQPPVGGVGFFLLGYGKERYFNIPDKDDYFNISFYKSKTTVQYLIPDDMGQCFDEDIKKVYFSRLVPFISRAKTETLLMSGTFKECTSIFDELLKEGFVKKDDITLSSYGIEGFSDYCTDMCDNGNMDELSKEFENEMKSSSALSYMIRMHGMRF